MAASILTDFDLFLFGEGNHHRIYDKLGAHLNTHDGVAGTHFAVWAPNASGVSLVGPFNEWDGRVNRMTPRASSGIWEIFMPQIGEGALYKYELHGASGAPMLKADPYGFAMQARPENASVVTSLDGFAWNDAEWLERRRHADAIRSAMNIYEVHLGSWKRPWDPRRVPFMNWREAVEHLLPYVLEMGYTHIELMGIAEHPLDASWGYQVTGYYAPTARYGTAKDFMTFVDRCHQAGIGLILDWVPAHFPRDTHGLAWFDGTALYEHADPRIGEHAEWGTKVFNYGRHEVRNFLIANALYWFDRFHIDGLRVDAVASMLYLDYSRKEGEWLPNRYGGRENIEAIEFLKNMNATVHAEFPGVLTIAEESTSFTGVTQSLQHGGLGFSLKWNMGWMNDTLKYMGLDPAHRRYHHQLITFSFVYAWSERYVLPISHDEVVHGKASLLSKMPGDDWQKRANVRLLLSYMFAHPGKKLSFMGSEFGQRREWRENEQLDWQLLTNEPHRQLQDFVKVLNRCYARLPQLFAGDADYDGFRWVDLHNSDESIWAFQRQVAGDQSKPPILCVFNATPVPRAAHVFGVPAPGRYNKVFDSDATRFGGAGYNAQQELHSEPYNHHDFQHVLRLDLPPLGAVFCMRND
jgi:1,4-alpha-glucan branching enzyme